MTREPAVQSREFTAHVMGGWIPGTVERMLRDTVARAEGRKIVLAVKPYKKKRTTPQNAFYWGVVIPCARQMFEDAGNTVDDEAVHCFLRAHVGGLKHAVHTPDGEVRNVLKSSTTLSTVEWENYIEKIRAWGAQWGLTIPPPNEGILNQSNSTGLEDVENSDFFLNEAVWRALGTDAQYRAWIQRQPSCVSGQFGEYVNGEGRCEAAHVRRAGQSGTGYKAEYACVPLTHAEHQLQHAEGEAAVIPFYSDHPTDSPQAKAWFNDQRRKYVQQWAKETLKAHLKYESLADIPPQEMRQWAEKHELTKYLPQPTKGE